MFENYLSLSADEQAHVKAIHKAIRSKSVGSRIHNLAWGFVRGFPYRRIERTTRKNNAPDARLLTFFIGSEIPGFAPLAAKWWDTAPHPAIEAWLADPSGAIAAPVRVKKPYTPPAPAEVA